MALTAFTPAFGGIPGGIELAVILIIAIIMFGIPVLVVLVGGGYLLSRSQSTDEDADADAERLAELEAKVDELHAELEAERAGEDEKREG